MKKSFMTLAAVLCCIMTMGLMNSCKENNQPTNPTEDKKLSVKMPYKFQASSDLLEYFDINIEYYDSVGDIKSEQLAQEEWEKTFVVDMPCTLGMRVGLEFKDGVDLSAMPSSVNISYDCQCIPFPDLTLGQDYSIEQISKRDESVDGKDIADWFEYLQQETGGYLFNYLITFDKNGHFTEGKWK